MKNFSARPNGCACFSNIFCFFYNPIDNIFTQNSLSPFNGIVNFMLIFDILLQKKERLTLSLFFTVFYCVNNICVKHEIAKLNLAFIFK